METKYLDARIKKYESWAKDGVIRHKEKLELIELKAIKEQLRLAVVAGSVPTDNQEQIN